jgi:hypothetical protein
VLPAELLAKLVGQDGAAQSGPENDDMRHGRVSSFAGPSYDPPRSAELTRLKAATASALDVYMTDI